MTTWRVQPRMPAVADAKYRRLSRTGRLFMRAAVLKHFDRGDGVGAGQSLPGDRFGFLAVGDGDDALKNHRPLVRAPDLANEPPSYRHRASIARFGAPRSVSVCSCQTTGSNFYGLLRIAHDA